MSAKQQEEAAYEEYSRASYEIHQEAKEKHDKAINEAVTKNTEFRIGGHAWVYDTLGIVRRVKISHFSHWWASIAIRYYVSPNNYGGAPLRECFSTYDEALDYRDAKYDEKIAELEREIEKVRKKKLEGRSKKDS